MLRRLANRPSSLFQRLMFSFAGVILGVAIIGLAWVFLEAKATQRSRTFSENKAHTANILAHLSDVGPNLERMLPVLAEIEANRVRMFQELDYHSHVRVRVWLHGRLVYTRRPTCPTGCRKSPPATPMAGCAGKRTTGCRASWSSAGTKSTTSGCSRSAASAFCCPRPSSACRCF